MRREIRFRGKRKGSNEWIYGYIREIWASKDDGRRFVICPSNCYENDGCTDLEGVEIIPETIGQFTGVKGEKGKDIYEGDIVKAYVERKTFVSSVKWGVKSNGWSLYCTVLSHKWDKPKYYKLPASHNIEVIGNVHDNPELLK